MDNKTAAAPPSTIRDFKPLYSRDKLLQLYGIDIAAAASSSVMVAPFISVVDRAIIENANGKRPLGQGLTQGFAAVFRQPHRFVATPQFRLVFGVYFSTYVTANFVDTTCEHQQVPFTTASWYKFVATSAINMSLCILKDRAFARLFGVTASHSLPILTYVCFAARDSLTIAASFNAPRLFAEWLTANNRISDPKTANVAAQLVCPGAVQFISTPLHLLGLDMYNRSGASISQRVGLVRSEYLKSTLARIGRIAPAFGIGGVGNTFFRSYRKRVVE